MDTEHTSSPYPFLIHPNVLITVVISIPKVDTVMLQSEKEKQIYKVIEEQPGINFRALMRKTGIWQGTLAPILTHLKGQGFILETKEGQYRRFRLTPKGYERLARLTGPTTDLLAFLKETKEGKKLLDKLEDLTRKSQLQETQINNIIKAFSGFCLMRFNKREDRWTRFTSKGWTPLTKEEMDHPEPPPPLRIYALDKDTIEEGTKEYLRAKWRREIAKARSKRAQKK